MEVKLKAQQLWAGIGGEQERDQNLPKSSLIYPTNRAKLTCIKAQIHQQNSFPLKSRNQSWSSRLSKAQSAMSCYILYAAGRSTCIESIWTNYMSSTRSYLCFRQLDLIWDTVYNRSTCRYTDDSDCLVLKTSFQHLQIAKQGSTYGCCKMTNLLRVEDHQAYPKTNSSHCYYSYRWQRTQDSARENGTTWFSWQFLDKVHIHNNLSVQKWHYFAPINSRWAHHCTYLIVWSYHQIL